MIGIVKRYDLSVTFIDPLHEAIKTENHVLVSNGVPHANTSGGMLTWFTLPMTVAYRSEFVISYILEEGEVLD
jgi:hypothetical protein